MKHHKFVERLHALGIDVSGTLAGMDLKPISSTFGPVERDADGLTDYDLRAYDDSLGKHERTVALCKRALEVARGEFEKAFKLAWGWYHGGEGPHTPGPGRSEQERARHIQRSLAFWSDKLYVLSDHNATDGPWFQRGDIEKTIEQNTGRYSSGEISMVENSNLRAGTKRTRRAKINPYLTAVVQLIIEKNIHTRAEDAKSGLSELRDVPFKAVTGMLQSVARQYHDLAQYLSVSHQSVAAAIQLVTMMPRSPLRLEREHDRKGHRCSSYVLRVNYKPGEWLLQHVADDQLQRELKQNDTTYSPTTSANIPNAKLVAPMRVSDGGRGGYVQSYAHVSSSQTLYSVHPSTTTVGINAAELAGDAAVRFDNVAKAGEPPPVRPISSVAGIEPPNTTFGQRDPWPFCALN